MFVEMSLRVTVLFWVFGFATIALASKDPELEQWQFTKQEEKEQKEGSEGQGWPYVFQDRHFSTKVETEHGYFRLLPKFTERSKLLKGIEDYRISILEADPHTFIIPNHWDTECILFVANGRGTISLIREDKRESFNLRHGDVMRIRAGTIFYMINRDENEKFVAVNLLQPVSTPGEYWPFFDAAGEEPESYYRSFSIELLEAAFNTSRDRLERIFKQQKEGAFLKASREQIEAMSPKEEEGRIWPFRGQSKDVFNLFNQRPSQSNQYGNLFEVEPNDWKQLQQLDVALSFLNITKGSMVTPSFNSKATKIVLVTEGEGYFEMACPHLSSSDSSGSSHQDGQSKSSPSYQRVSSRLKSGMVFIIPPGHPLITVASQNQNLQVLCFAVHAQGNRKIPLAGKRNIFSQMEKEAKELSFNAKAEEFDEVFQSQGEEFFLKGPRQQQGQVYA